MNLLEMLNIEFRILVQMGKPFVLTFMVLVGIQFVVYRVFKFSIFNGLIKVALKEINK